MTFIQGNFSVIAIYHVQGIFFFHLLIYLHFIISSYNSFFYTLWKGQRHPLVRGFGKVNSEDLLLFHLRNYIFIYFYFLLSFTSFFTSHRGGRETSIHPKVWKSSFWGPIALSHFLIFSLFSSYILGRGHNCFLPLSYLSHYFLILYFRDRAKTSTHSRVWKS